MKGDYMTKILLLLFLFFVACADSSDVVTSIDKTYGTVVYDTSLMASDDTSDLDRTYVEDSVNTGIVFFLWDTVSIYENGELLFEEVVSTAIVPDRATIPKKSPGNELECVINGVYYNVYIPFEYPRAKFDFYSTKDTLHVRYQNYHIYYD